MDTILSPKKVHIKTCTGFQRIVYAFFVREDFWRIFFSNFREGKSLKFWLFQRKGDSFFFFVFFRGGGGGFNFSRGAFLVGGGFCRVLLFLFVFCQGLPPPFFREKEILRHFVSDDIGNSDRDYRLELSRAIANCFDSYADSCPNVQPTQQNTRNNAYFGNNTHNIQQ